MIIKTWYNVIVGIIILVFIVLFFSHKEEISVPSHPEESNTIKYATISTNKVNMRSCPSVECSSTAKFRQGTKVKVIDLGKDGWSKIERLDEDGQRQIGYVNGEFLKQDK